MLVSISWRINMRPAGMALAANESLPIIDKISLFLHFLRLMIALVSISSSLNFSVKVYLSLCLRK